MKKEFVNIGIVGCGKISEYHINALRLIPQARIVAYCDIIMSRAETWACGTADVYDDWHQVVARKDIDLIMILTPNNLHCEIAVASAKAGKDVFVQKPMARTPEEGSLMIQAAKDCGVRLFQSYMHRYFEETIWTRNFIKEGGLGNIYLARIRNSLPGSDYSTWQYNSELCGKGGAIIDVGVHGIDLVRYLLGEIEEVVVASKGQHIFTRLINDEEVHPDNEDWALTQYKMKNGAMVTHEISWIQKWHCNRFVMEIHGEKGSVYIRTGYGPLAVTSTSVGKPGEMVFPALETVPFGYRQHKEVIDCILEDKEAICSGEDGVAALKIVQEVLKKA